MTLAQKILYIWRIFAKLLSFACFGVGGFILGTAWFPTLFVASGFSRKRFGKWARYSIHLSLKLFVIEMELLGLLTLNVEHRERLKEQKSKVVVANHPSLLDVVMLYSLIPNADCIVKGSLAENRFIRGIINAIYIPNSRSFDEQLKNAATSLNQGNCLIIFPEGTRSVSGMPWTFKKGAARFALSAQKDVLPIYFGGNEIIGLRKYDKLLSYHPTSRYYYNLDVLEPIEIATYLHCPKGQAASMLTEKMLEVFEERRRKDPYKKWYYEGTNCDGLSDDIVKNFYYLRK
ncbi:MAG: 1-acyl-sn-glycerol-3-phosphate acyltransferase [Fibrobacteraceae bacterium]|nr:1-acyl-sn-glycerol-3-phosphate acyltransferase [Fibrobacteraceae bacterium]